MIKTDEEIANMERGGKILRRVYKKIREKFIPGISTKEIDGLCSSMIIEEGGDISFNKVEGYKWASCTSINEQVVHTPPSNRKLRDGDIFTFDFGVYYKGFHVDFSDTIYIGNSIDEDKKRFLIAGEKALHKAIDQAKVGNYIGDISRSIQRSIEGSGYVIMKNLTGHGVGRELHENPLIPGYLDRPINKTMKLKKNMTLAIEVIYSETCSDYSHEDDWSLISKDRSLSACFEHTILVDKKPRILT